jgi:hypothetical protein
LGVFPEAALLFFSLTESDSVQDPQASEKGTNPQFLGMF